MDRVLRGGSWEDGPEDLRAAGRHTDIQDIRISYIGFRLARITLSKKISRPAL
ncbi:MAG: SUMF1/EgtB/PvdO family nonheme iron enzyme [Methylocella sp.]